MDKITYSSALASLRKAVASKPDGYVYHNPFGNQAGDLAHGVVHCFYFDSGTQLPSCLVGHVLADHGVTYADMEGLNAVGALNCVDDLFGPEAPQDAATRSLLFAAQQYQDAGYTWADSAGLAALHTE